MVNLSSPLGETAQIEASILSGYYPDKTNAIIIESYEKREMALARTGSVERNRKSHRGQLLTMIRYLRMNPQRLATKKLKPGYFCIQQNIEISGRIYNGVGNAAILTAEQYMPVHVRRIMVESAEHGDDSALRNYMNACVLAARKGTVMVSPFISPNERRIQAKLLEEGLPFICIADNGFGDYYKPTDGLFDAVAAGQVMILSPWEYDQKKKHVTREECVAMNKMAEEISAELTKAASVSSEIIVPLAGKE